MQVTDVGHIVVDPDVLGGKPHIAGHRIAVSHVAVWTNYHHVSPAEIAEQFHLTLGEVHSALAYCYDHKDEMDREIADAVQHAEEMARQYPHGWTPESEQDVPVECP